MRFVGRSVGLAVIVGMLALTYLWGRWDERTGRTMPLAGTAHAATPPSDTTPVGVVDPRDVYYPGSEALAPDEMRIVALGTGQPSARPKQASACWLVELGNGDKFLFDLGAGCHERIAAQKIPYDFMDKVFLSHLHVDHYGDLASFWLDGSGGRPASDRCGSDARPRSLVRRLSITRR